MEAQLVVGRPNPPRVKNELTLMIEGVPCKLANLGKESPLAANRECLCNIHATIETYKVQIIELTREAAVTTQHGVPPFYVMSPPPSRAASWPVPTARAPRHQRCVGVLLACC